MTAQQKSLLHLPKLIAHRGASAFAPENTLVSLQEAKAMGAEWVEFDVMLARYGTPIIFHDAELDRTTSGRGKISFTSYKVISQLDAGSWFGDKYNTGVRVPTLEEWLKACAELKLGINLEMKVSRYRAPLIARAVVTAIARYWNKRLPVPLLSSQSKTCLRAVHALNPHLQLGYITDNWEPKWQRVLDRLHCVSLHIDHRRLSKKRVMQVKATDRKVLAYTVNDRQRAEELFAMGVDSIFTNDPQLLTRTIVVKKGKRREDTGGSGTVV